MNRLNLVLPGGFPLDQGMLDWMQGSILTVQQLAVMAGPLGILSGCEVVDGTAAAGYVVINGEVLPFTGGVVEAKVIIVEDTTDVTYHNGDINPSKINRQATFGDDGVTDYEWSNFVRFTQPWLTGDIKEIDCSLGYMGANFDITGLGINERVGWAVCNGSNGTRDRRGKTSVQYDAAQAEFDSMGETGGEKKHVLTAAEVPPLNTGNDFAASAGTGFSGYAKTVVGSLGHEAVNASAGADAHNNLQPYIVTLIIQKL